jgi:hypothetical protein
MILRPTLTRHSQAGLHAKPEKPGVMRISPLAPAQLNPDQRCLYDDMTDEIGRDLGGFKAMDESSALIGPFNVWMREQNGGARFGT